MSTSRQGKVEKEVEKNTTTTIVCPRKWVKKSLTHFEDQNILLLFVRL